MKSLVWVKVALPGFHYWEHASGKRDYLASRHRHLFHIEVEVPVSHDDRDVEFHDLQDLVRVWWGPSPREWGGSSCETIARTLADYLVVSGVEPSRVTISEDGESGATITWENS